MPWLPDCNWRLAEQYGMATLQPVLRRKFRCIPAPDSGKAYKNLSAREKSMVWLQIRRDAIEAAQKFPKPDYMVCGPCLIGFHDDCATGKCSCCH